MQTMLRQAKEAEIPFNNVDDNFESESLSSSQGDGSRIFGQYQNFTESEEDEEVYL